MQIHYDAQVRLLKGTVLTSPGATDSGLRQLAYSTAQSDHPKARIEAVPAVLQTYLEKVARHAYKVTDEDIQRLQQAGYSEEAIFEITVSAALGAGLGRLERGLAALQEGGNHAIENS